VRTKGPFCGGRACARPAACPLFRRLVSFTPPPLTCDSNSLPSFDPAPFQWLRQSSFLPPMNKISDARPTGPFSLLPSSLRLPSRPRFSMNKTPSSGRRDARVVSIPFPNRFSFFSLFLRISRRLTRDFFFFSFIAFFGSSVRPRYESSFPSVLFVSEHDLCSFPLDRVYPPLVLIF